MGSDVLAEIRKAATRAGLVLMMHANSLEAQKFAVDGDADVVAHGLWNWGDLDEQTELPAEISRLLDLVVQKRIGYQPTIQVMQGLRAYFDPEYLTMKAIPKVIPAEMLAWFNSSEGKWFKREIAEDSAPDAAVLQGFDQGPLRRVRQLVAYLASKDANFLFGTDTPSGPTYGNLPGVNGYLEMQQLQRAGENCQSRPAEEITAGERGCVRQRRQGVGSWKTSLTRQLGRQFEQVIRHSRKS
jgi:hypothetical protein